MPKKESPSLVKIRKVQFYSILWDVSINSFRSHGFQLMVLIGHKIQTYEVNKWDSIVIVINFSRISTTGHQLNTTWIFIRNISINFIIFTGPRKYVRISSQNWSSRPPSKSTTLGLTESDTLNSIGSENGSLSDIHSER